MYYKLNPGSGNMNISDFIRENQDVQEVAEGAEEQV